MTDPAGGRLERLLRRGVFCVTAEVVPPRSADPSAVTAQAEALAGSVDAANVTDNPTSRVHMSPVAGAGLVAQAGLEPVLQLTCRDRNRMAISSDLLGAWALGARNLLCLSGDPPGAGDHPDAKTVFDLDVLDLIRLAAGLRNHGTLLSGDAIESPPRYFVGVADSPLAENYDVGRLERKREAGAEFVQTQIVFDVAAFGEWADRARSRGIFERMFVLAGVAVARSPKTAYYINEHLPGVVVPPRLIQLLEDAGPDAEAEGIRLAVEIVAKIKAIQGIAGIHVMGLGQMGPVRRVIEAAGLLPRPAAV